AGKNRDQWPSDDKYRLADYVGWSTETEPSTMPAGDVTVTRQFVLKVTGTYKVEIYLETVEDGVYENPRSFSFYDNVGQTVSVGESDDDTVKISSFGSGIPFFQYYEYTEVEGENGTLLSGVVTNTNEGEDELVLRVYMNRKVMTSTITYYADTQKIAETTKSAKWGHTYHYDALSLFDVSEGGVWTDGETRGSLTFTGTVEGQTPDAYDFRNNNYVAIYSGYYVLNDVEHWPTKDYNSVASLGENPEIIMGQSSNRASVRYSKVDPDNMFRIKIGYNSSALSHGVNQWVPLTYTDEGTGTLYSEIWAANEAYFFKDVNYVVDESFAEYPGLGMYNLKNGNPSAQDGRYFYDTAGELKDGFSRVTINGKTYYQNGNALYIPVSRNNLYVGKWTSYTIPTDEVGYQDVTDFLADYKETWADDPYAQGAYVYSRGWGSTVKYDTSDATLTVTFRNGNVYQISYNLGGTICSDESHTYAAGSTVGTIGCDHTIILPREGYEVVWYADSGFENKPSLPFTINEDRIFYGRYEKKIVKSTAYAYYETADHPEIDG
ncbi:MAG: hypothetical protein HUJ73_03010, partial [Eubacterium sp.]|nr:hypothetical protein [Eubacterium sp.]